MSNIQHVEFVGFHETCDLEVDHPDHQFYLANGMLTSNSHATAYAIDSYMCAFLLTHYEEQWLVAYLESMDGNDGGRAKAFSEVRAMGYDIVSIDVMHATKSWTVLSGKRLMPALTSVKGVGDTAADELQACRPFTTLEELLWNQDGSWRLKKFNKRALEALIDVEAFESLGCVGEGKLFANYRQMHHVLVERGGEIKKQSKKDPHAGMKKFYEIVRETSAMEPYARLERVRRSAAHFGTIDINVVIDQKFRTELAEKDIRSLDSYDSEDIYWFCLLEATPKQTKNKKNYLIVKAMGTSGTIHRVNVWGWNGKTKFEPYSVIVAPLSCNDFGFATMAFKMNVLDL